MAASSRARCTNDVAVLAALEELPVSLKYSENYKTGKLDKALISSGKTLPSNHIDLPAPASNELDCVQTPPADPSKGRALPDA
jgi:hypothetical protein